MYYVYILANPQNSVLYTGVTNDLIRRLHEHCRPNSHGFTHRYNTTKLVYYEEYTQVLDAINREKQIKAGSRKKKEALINQKNSDWHDVSGSLL